MAGIKSRAYTGATFGGDRRRAPRKRKIARVRVLSTLHALNAPKRRKTKIKKRTAKPIREAGARKVAKSRGSISDSRFKYLIKNLNSGGTLRVPDKKSSISRARFQAGEGGSDMQYVFLDEFGPSLRELFAKGGPFRKAAETVLAMKQKVTDKFSHREIFSIAQTHHGENRIPHCVKYELTGRARLVTVVNNGICVFLFAGDHNTTDSWLDKNRGIDFIAKRQGEGKVIEPVFVSPGTDKSQIIKTGNDLGSPAKLFDLLSMRYRSAILKGIPINVLNSLESIDSIATDDDVINAVDGIEEEERKIAILDVLLLLRVGDATGAKNRIDTYTGEARLLSELSPTEAAEIVSGERVVRIEDIDAAVFEHFVRTAEYQKWMLYLHPSQRQYVDGDYRGAAKLAGVSGSGKTCVLIHRALRLAEQYPGQKVLILTLNAALAMLIKSLISGSREKRQPANLLVSSFWEVCRNKLIEIEPHNDRLYTQQTIAPNPYAVSEHIDDIWDEYYNCEANNRDAELMFPLHRSLLVRRIFPKDYIKQEFDYLRSASAAWERKEYLTMERSGRAIPLERPFRNQVIDGLAGWEKKMKFVGAIDAIGIVTNLYRHLARLEPEYRCILVDEVQDFGTLELAVIRKLVSEDENDLFLCGDAAQTVSMKSQDFDAAGISIKGRSMKLEKNYRNSRQILTAAHDVLMRNYEKTSKGIVDLEILPPEYANFSSSRPNLLEAKSLRDEIEHAWAYATSVVAENGHKKVCIAIAGYHQRGIEEFGKRMGLGVLNGDINIVEGKVFLAELEQTKGFEFDTVIVLNAHSGVLPHPDLPAEESFRDLCKLYVAMTRAKLELIVSYHDSVTSFIGDDREHFASGKWEDYAQRRPLDGGDLPRPGIAEKKFGIEWDLTGKDFLRMPEAIGLPANAQEKLIDCVTGRISFEGTQKKQKTWKSIGEFLNDMIRPVNRRRVNLSDEAWQAIALQFRRPSGLEAKKA